MRSETKPLTADEIVRLEFAGSSTHVKEILDEWNSKEWVPLAIHALYLDFVFIFLYGSTLALGCLTFPSLTEKINLMNWGMRFYRFSLYAGLADFLENLCLFQELHGNTGAFFPAAAWALALIKFTIIVSVFLFLFRCIIQWAVKGVGGLLK